MKSSEVEQKEIDFQKEMNLLRIEKGMPPENFRFVAVGWLDISEPFETGEVPNGFLNKLRVLWHQGLILSTLGSHLCEFCEGKERASSSQQKVLIDRENEVKYIFPEMIFHYIEFHKYLPPKEFIEFVIKN